MKRFASLRPPDFLRRFMIPLAFALTLAAVVTAPAFGQQSAPPDADSRTRPLWEVGAVGLGVSQQAYPGSDRQVNRALALPWLVYRGRYLRADNEGVGLRAVRTPRYEFDVSAAGAFGSRAGDDPKRQGMPDLGTLVEIGPRLRVHLGGTPEGGRWRLDLPLRGVYDLSDSLAYRGAVFQPGISWQRRSPSGWNIGAGASLVIADERLARTFYAVDPAYATAARPAYEAQAGLLATRFSATLSKSITPDWTLFGFARLDSVAGAANRDSPLVSRTAGASVGVGASWTWMRSSQFAND